MRAIHEQPRLVVAKALGAVCLVLIGVAIGAAMKRGDGDRAQATDVRLVSAQRAVNARQIELRTARGRAERAEAKLRDANASVRALTQSSQRLRRELHAARRARRHAKRQP